MKVTRVLRGDFFPSKNETRLAPLEFGAVNFTRIRRGISFPSKNETFSLRCAGMSTNGRGMSVKPPLNPNQAAHPSDPTGMHSDARLMDRSGGCLLDHSLGDRGRG